MHTQEQVRWQNIDHILEDLKPWLEFHPDVILDGELYNHDLRETILRKSYL